MTNYGTSRCYKIEAVIFDESIETYKLEEGTLMQYYEKKYNIKIRKPKQPLLKVADVIHWFYSEKIKDHFTDSLTLPDDWPF